MWSFKAPCGPHPVLPEDGVQVGALAQVEDRRKRRVIDLEDVEQRDDVGMSQSLCESSVCVCVSASKGGDIIQELKSTL